MKEYLTNNYPLVIAFSLPILLVVVVALVNIMPSLWLTTDYNFLYATCRDDGRYNNQCFDYVRDVFVVENGRLVVKDVSAEYTDNGNNAENNTLLFFHNTQTNESREITIEEAQGLELSSLVTSPDGVAVTRNRERGNDFIFFYSGSSYGYYLTKGNSRQELELIDPTNTTYFRNNFHFVGWILPGRN